MNSELTITPKAELVLERFCGRELHPIKQATWNLYPDEQMGLMNLCLFVEAARGTLLHEDTEQLGVEPCWEINVLEKDLSSSSLIKGAAFRVPDGYDEARDSHLAYFYYCEYKGTNNNSIQILAVEGMRLLIQITGETLDVNFYDGSKPPTKLFVETWFTHHPETWRSMQ